MASRRDAPLIQIARSRPDPPPTPAGRVGIGPADVAWPDVVASLRDGAFRDRRAEADGCELCGAAIEPDHGHVADVTRGTLLCACRPCRILFAHDGAGRARLRAVPDRYVEVPELDDAREVWDALGIPIGLTFLLPREGGQHITAFYPSPAGATESALELGAWRDLVSEVPALRTMTPDVETLLVRRTDAAPGGSPRGREGADVRRLDAIIVPIDTCYQLVARIRQLWTGLQGGDEVRDEIDAFFAWAGRRSREGPA